MAFIPDHEVIVARDAPPERTVFVLHGIFGSGRNWRGFTERFVVSNPTWRAILVHLRGHGGSRDAPGPHTLRACAEDLRRLGEQLGGAPDVVWGHSFGGKVALAYARDVDGAGLRSVWALDSPPGAGDTDGRDPVSSEVGRLIEAVRKTPLPVVRRSEVQEHLLWLGLSRSVAGWMSANLVRAPEGEGYRWHFSPESLEELLADYWKEDLWPTAESPPGDAAVHLVRAGRSDRWTEQDRDRLARLEDAPHTKIHVLPKAGHWLHVDDPDGLLELLGRSNPGERRL